MRVEAFLEALIDAFERAPGMRNPSTAAHGERVAGACAQLEGQRLLRLGDADGALVVSERALPVARCAQQLAPDPVQLGLPVILAVLIDQAQARVDQLEPLIEKSALKARERSGCESPGLTESRLLIVEGRHAGEDDVDTAANLAGSDTVLALEDLGARGGKGKAVAGGDALQLAQLACIGLAAVAARMNGAIHEQRHRLREGLRQRMRVAHGLGDDAHGARGPAEHPQRPGEMILQRDFEIDLLGEHAIGRHDFSIELERFLERLLGLDELSLPEHAGTDHVVAGDEMRRLAAASRALQELGAHGSGDPVLAAYVV